MRSFQHVVVFLFALLVCAFAQETDTAVYESTVYITSTVYRVNTVTLSGTPSSSAVDANSTTTISATYAPTNPSYPVVSSGKANGTSIAVPTGSATKPSASPPQFTGAASALNANAYIAALAAGLGYLVL